MEQQWQSFRPRSSSGLEGSWMPPSTDSCMAHLPSHTGDKHSNMWPITRPVLRQIYQWPIGASGQDCILRSHLTTMQCREELSSQSIQETKLNPVSSTWLICLPSATWRSSVPWEVKRCIRETSKKKTVSSEFHWIWHAIERITTGLFRTTTMKANHLSQTSEEISL